MVAAAPAAHGVLFKSAQTRRGFAGVGKAHARALELGHQGGGGGGNAGKTHRQVEGRALAGHQGSGPTLQLQQALACHHRLTISHQQLQPQRRIQQAKQRLHQHPAAKHPWRLGQPVGPAMTTSQGRSREIAAANIFCQPGAQLRLQLGGKRQMGSRHYPSGA